MKMVADMQQLAGGGWSQAERFERISTRFITYAHTPVQACRWPISWPT